MLQILNKSCPLPEVAKSVPPQAEIGAAATPPSKPHPNVKFHGRRLRQRQEKNYYENSRRSNNSSASNNNSVKSLQLSPHKVDGAAAVAHAQQLSALKSSVQSYFRASQTFTVLARRRSPGARPAFLIQWDSTAP